jgi:hypothetical protein
MLIARDAFIAQVSNIGCKWLCEVNFVFQQERFTDLGPTQGKMEQTEKDSKSDSA